MSLYGPDAPSTSTVKSIGPMRQRLFGLAAAAALVLPALAAPAQTPDRPDGARQVIAADPRAGTAAAAAVTAALDDSEGVPPRHAVFQDRCGMPVAIQPEPAAETEAAGRFDPDAAMRAATAAGARALLLIAAGPAECLSVACALSAGAADAEPPLRIDVLALHPSAEDLRCLAANTGGEWRLVTPETLARAAGNLVPPPPQNAGALGQGESETGASGPGASGTAVAGSPGGAPDAAGPQQEASGASGNPPSGLDGGSGSVGAADGSPVNAVPVPPVTPPAPAGQAAPSAWDGDPPLPQPRP